VDAPAGSFTALDHISAYPIPPGAHLEEELEERGIPPADFARDIGISGDEMDALLAGDCTLSMALAAKLERALGLSAKLWLGLEADYRAALATCEAILRERSAQAPPDRYSPATHMRRVTS
jgi:addiction module HigA family antidote